MVQPTIKSSSESQDLLRVPGHCQPKIRNTIPKTVNNLIINCVYNVVKGNVPGLTQEKVNKLASHKTSLIKLTKKVPIKEKKGSRSERWWIFSIFTSPCCSLNS